MIRGAFKVKNMRNIVLLVVLLFLTGLSSLAINEHCPSFIGSLVAVNSGSPHKDSDKLKILLHNNSSSKDLSSYVFYSDNHWFLLSKNADKLVKQLIGKDKLKTGTCFVVKGYRRSHIIIVKQISDISIQQF